MPTTPTPAAGDSPTFKIVSQVPQLVAGAPGQYVQGYRVTAQMDGTGTTFFVDVPAANYTADVVAPLLREKAAEIAAVHQITS